jgi:Tfp pilus assembly protein PilF
MLKEAIASDEKIGDAHAALGKIFEKRDQTDQAIECYNKALKLPHSNNNIYFNIGVLHEKKK